MKTILRTLLVAITVMMCATAAMAQANDGKRLSREELAVNQAKYIAHELALDEATTNKYVETYCAYQKEVWALGPRKDLNVEQRLERSQKVLDLRKKYLAIYRGFLTETQVDRAYRLEKKVLDRMRTKNARMRKRQNR